MRDGTVSGAKKGSWRLAATSRSSTSAWQATLIQKPTFFPVNCSITVFSLPINIARSQGSARREVHTTSLLFFLSSERQGTRLRRFAAADRHSYSYTGIEAFIESISGAVSQRAPLRGTYRLRASGIFHRAPTHRAGIPRNVRSFALVRENHERRNPSRMLSGGANEKRGQDRNGR